MNRNIGPVLTERAAARALDCRRVPAWLWAASGALGACVACGAPMDEEQQETLAQDVRSTKPQLGSINANEHPALALKRANPASYDAPLVLRTMLESNCGPEDLQYVNAYTGTLGPSKEFVQNHKVAVAALAPSTSAGKYCSGTLVGRDLFLTASHCVGANTVGHVAAFNYELSGGAGSAALTQRFYTVTEVVTDDTSLDFALLRLGGEPGVTYPWTAINSIAHGTGSPISIIQHPDGRPKQIEGGSISSHDTDYYHYADLDTLPGSSGSGILNVVGELIGIHTNGGCTATTGENSGVKVSRAVQRSDALAAQSGRTPTFLFGDFGGDARADVVQAFAGWGSLPRCEGKSGNSFDCKNSTATLYDFGSNEQQFLSADFTGDGFADVVQTFGRFGSIPTCSPSGNVWVCNNYPATQYDSDSVEQKSLVADVNGDLRSDVIQTYRGWGSIPTCKSNGNGYSCTNPAATIYNSGSSDQEFLVGDVDGDGRDDVLQTYRGWSSIPMCKANGNGYSCSNPTATIYNSGSTEQKFLVGDFDGDYRDDVIQTYRGWTSIPLCTSTSIGWSCSNPPATIHNSGSPEQKFLVGDFNADGRDDVAQVFRGWGSIPVCLSTGTGWNCGNWPATIHNGSEEQRFHVADVNADGRDDIVQTFRRWGSYPTCLSTGGGWNCTNTPATLYDTGP